MADFARAELLRELREARHLSQEAVAQELGVTTKTVGSWERGKGIHWQNAKRVAEFYGVEPERIVSRDNGDGPTPELLDRLGPTDRLAEVENRLNEVLAVLREDVLPALSDLEAAVAESRSEAAAPSRRGRSAKESR